MQTKDQVQFQRQGGLSLGQTLKVAGISTLMTVFGIGLGAGVYALAKTSVPLRDDQAAIVRYQNEFGLSETKLIGPGGGMNLGAIPMEFPYARGAVEEFLDFNRAGIAVLSGESLLQLQSGYDVTLTYNINIPSENAEAYASLDHVAFSTPARDYASREYLVEDLVVQFFTTGQNLDGTPLTAHDGTTFAGWNNAVGVVATDLDYKMNLLLDNLRQEGLYDELVALYANPERNAGNADILRDWFGGYFENNPLAVFGSDVSVITDPELRLIASVYLTSQNISVIEQSIREGTPAQVASAYNGDFISAAVQNIEASYDDYGTSLDELIVSSGNMTQAELEPLITTLGTVATDYVHTTILDAGSAALFEHGVYDRDIEAANAANAEIYDTGIAAINGELTQLEQAIGPAGVDRATELYNGFAAYVASGVEVPISDTETMTLTTLNELTPQGLFIVYGQYLSGSGLASFDEIGNMTLLDETLTLDIINYAGDLAYRTYSETERDIGVARAEDIYSGFIDYISAGVVLQVSETETLTLTSLDEFSVQGIFGQLDQYLFEQGLVNIDRSGRVTGADPSFTSGMYNYLSNLVFRTYSELGRDSGMAAFERVESDPVLQYFYTTVDGMMDELPPESVTQSLLSQQGFFTELNNRTGYGYLYDLVTVGLYDSLFDHRLERLGVDMENVEGDITTMVSAYMAGEGNGGVERAMGMWNYIFDSLLAGNGPVGTNARNFDQGQFLLDYLQQPGVIAAYMGDLINVYNNTDLPQIYGFTLSNPGGRMEERQ